MRTILLILLSIFASASYGQALITDLMQSPDPSSADGFRYQNVATYTDSYYLEVRFRIDSAKFDSAINYRCTGFYPLGAFVFDSASGAQYGHWNAVIGGNQRFCFIEYSDDGGSSTDKAYFEWDVALDTCYTFIASRSNNVTTATLNGVPITYNASPGTYQWENRANGVTIGKESQSYNDPLDFDSFPGEIYYVNENGYIVDDFTNGILEGSATIGASVCEGGDPVPPPPPGPCELDSTSVECACETTPHPACNTCSAN